MTTLIFNCTTPLQITTKIRNEVQLLNNQVKVTNCAKYLTAAAQKNYSTFGAMTPRSLLFRSGIAVVPSKSKSLLVRTGNDNKNCTKKNLAK
jgi:hypothetical protein